MGKPSTNETWIIEFGDVIVSKKASSGVAALTPLEKLVYCVWIADYSMRNAGDLMTAADLYSDFQTEGARLAKDLSLQVTYQAFALSKDELQRQYLDRFEDICNEIKSV
jgi:hypothetical protein